VDGLWSHYLHIWFLLEEKTGLSTGRYSPDLTNSLGHRSLRQMTEREVEFFFSTGAGLLLNFDLQ
jgi:hypothetical protein